MAHSIDMEVTYELKQKDFFDSLIAFRNRSVFVKWAYRLMVGIVFLSAGGGLVLLAVRPSSQLLSNLVPALALAVMWGGLMWASPWWSARNQFFNQPGAQGPRTMTVDSSGLHWRWNGGSADIEWKNFTRFQETKNQFMLFSSPVCFNIVPKRALTAEQSITFRRLVREKLPPANDKKVSPQTWVFLAVVIVAAVLLVTVIRNIR